MKRRSLSEWLEEIDRWIKRTGRRYVSRDDLALEFDITPNYAGDLLRQYAKKHGLVYHRGVLYVRTGAEP